MGYFLFQKVDVPAPPGAAAASELNTSSQGELSKVRWGVCSMGLSSRYFMV